MGKEELNIVDFIFALNKVAKDEVKELAGDNEAEHVEMSDKIESDVKSFLTKFTGKQEPDGKDI